jgi:hypothetical protein
LPKTGHRYVSAKVCQIFPKILTLIFLTLILTLTPGCGRVGHPRNPRLVVARRLLAPNPQRTSRSSEGLLQKQETLKIVSFLFFTESFFQIKKFASHCFYFLRKCQVMWHKLEVGLQLAARHHTTSNYWPLKYKEHGLVPDVNQE